MTFLYQFTKYLTYLAIFLCSFNVGFNSIMFFSSKNENLFPLVLNILLLFLNAYNLRKLKENEKELSNE